MQPRNPDQDRFTGEVEPVAGIDLEVPEFDPRAYMKVPGEKAKLSRAIVQCPSPWELGARIHNIVKKDKT